MPYATFTAATPADLAALIPHDPPPPNFAATPISASLPRSLSAGLTRGAPTPDMAAPAAPP